MARDSATTTATPSPWYLALSFVSGQWGGLLMSWVTGQAMSNGPAHSKSWPEKAATTPGMARALETSTALIRACANGLRTTAIHSIPGTDRSSVYLACPVRNSASSFRRTG
ncbi:hypothetical protein HRbin12_01426 [bacterium HR12]|nr:hypothetical protein HRbin12_01426 [bacterium HR12]